MIMDDNESGTQSLAEQGERGETNASKKGVFCEVVAALGDAEGQRSHDEFDEPSRYQEGVEANPLTMGRDCAGVGDLIVCGSSDGVDAPVNSTGSNNHAVMGHCVGVDTLSAQQNNTGKLVLCPTPLGNLGDITLRTLEALKACDVVCAEDTRVTGKLLAAYGIEKRLERLDEALIGKRADWLIDRVLNGEVIAYCSDAGMPGVSDPGMRLVARARERGAWVEVLPGASAAALAYVASGVTCTNFYFGGFFPRKDSERRALLQSLASLDAALIFYESPHRVAEAVSIMAEVFPFRRGALCRELTKLHEEVLFLPLPDLTQSLRERVERSPIKGEIALVIDGPSAAEREQASHMCAANARDRALELLQQGVRKKDIARTLCEEFDLPRNTAYDLVLEVAASC